MSGYGSTLSILTATMPVGPKDPNRCYCPSCSGSGFDKMNKGSKRHARKCQRCRGQGSTVVGSTKR